MNKKQRNRKIVTQNKRNRMINRRYSSTIKTLFKLFSFKMKSLTGTNLIIDSETSQKTKQQLILLVGNLYSMIDKAIKKDVIHKNTAARKKSRIGKMISKIS
jgi:small subunit ribosomal protein S20